MMERCQKCVAGHPDGTPCPPQYAALPTDSKERKDIPLARGVLDYFPAALAEVARVSKAGNDQHNPGQEMHHARGKSTDHPDCIVRHLVDRGTVDTDGQRHTAKAAWRCLALLQEELEAAGAPLARAARLPEEPKPVKHCGVCQIAGSDLCMKHQLCKDDCPDYTPDPSSND